MESNSSPDQRPTTIRGAYWFSSKAATFPIERIDTRYFTHLFYATVEIDPQTLKLQTLDETQKALIRKFISTLHQKSPPLKCFLSIGQPNDRPNAFSEMAKSRTARNGFINSTIQVARDYGFDGLDLYWKYPKSADMNNLKLLFQEWRDSIKNTYLLSAVVYFTPKFFPTDENRAYPFDAINSCLDFVNVVCYDYYGTEDGDASYTAEHALLKDKEGRKSTLSGISSWIEDAGVPVTKLVMGLPLYGRTWTLADPNVNGIGASAVGFGSGGGVKEYTDIVTFIDNNGGIPVDDPNTVSAYSNVGTEWVGYDSTTSIKSKVLYAKKAGLAGYFFWALGMDRFYALPNEASNAWRE